MKKILIPTDFSSVAQNAYNYAKEMAAYIDAQLKVINVSYPDQDKIKGLIPSMEELIKHQELQLNSFVQNDEALEKGVITEVKVEQEVIIGFPKEEIQKYSKREEVDMIVMGTTGSGGILDKWLGSISSEIAQKAHCPVWLVAPDASFKGIKNILYAGNYESANSQMLQEISGLASRFDANIHMVHVCKEKTFESNQITEVVMERLFKKNAPDLDFKMGTVLSEKVWEGLDYYARENEIDLIVIVTKQRTFWDSLRHKSVAKEMVFHTQIPLLIMHLDK